MRAIYDNDVYANHNPNWHEEDSPWKSARIEEIIRRNHLKFESLCEVGCGTGEILLNLSKAFPAVRMDGYEISDYAYDRAVRKETNSVRFHKGELPADAVFDVLVVADVVEHVEDYVGFVKSLKPRAKHKIVHFPLDLSVQSLMRSWPIMKLRADVGHLHYFFKESALATLKDCGYKIIDYQYTASRLELPGQAFTSKLMKLPRRALFAMNQDFAVRVLGGWSLLVLAE